MKYEPFLKGAGNNSTTTSIHDGKLPVSLSPILGYGCAVVILMVFLKRSKVLVVLSNGMVVFDFFFDGFLIYTFFILL